MKLQSREKYWQDQVSKQKKMLYQSASGRTVDSKDKDLNEFNFLSSFSQKMKQGDKDGKERDHPKMTNVGREKFMQEISKLMSEIKELKEVIANQEKEIEQKNRKIEELSMKTMGGGNFNYERMKAQAREEETDKVTQGAAKTIAIMQGMIDDKTNQIKKQEDIISKMREDHRIQKEADNQEINNLRNEVMKQNEQLVNVPIQGVNSYAYFEEQEKMIRGGQKSTNEFLQLEEQLKVLKVELSSQKLVINQLEEDKSRLQQRLFDESNRVGDLLQEIDVIKSNNQPNYLRNEVVTLKKLLKKKDEDIKHQLKALEELKKGGFEVAGLEDEKNKIQKQLQARVDEETRKRKELESKTESYLSRIEQLNTQNEKLRKDLQEQSKEELNWKNKYYSVKDKEFEEKKEEKKEEEKTNKTNKSSLTGKLTKKPGKESKKLGKKDDNVRKKPSKDEDGISAFLEQETQEQKEKEALIQRNKELQQTVTELKQLHQTSRSQLHYDNNSYLSPGPGTFGHFRNWNDLKQMLNQFLKENWWINFNQGMKSHAFKQEQTKVVQPFGIRTIVNMELAISEEQFWKELESININIHNDDKKIIQKIQPWNDYISFYYDIKNMKSIAIGEYRINDDLPSQLQQPQQSSIQQQKQQYQQSIIMEESKFVSTYQDEKQQIYQKQIIELKKTVKDLEKKLDQEQKKSRNLEEQLDQLSNMTSSSLKKQLGSTQPLRSGSNKFGNQQEHQDRIFELENELEEQKREITQKQLELKKSNQKSIKLEKKIEELTNKNKEFSQKILQLTSMSSEDKRYFAETEKENQLRNLKQKISLMEKEITTLTEKLNETEEEYLMSKQSNEDWELKIQRLNRRINELEQLANSQKLEKKSMIPNQTMKLTQKKKLFH